MRSKLLVVMLILIVLMSSTAVYADNGLNGVTAEPKETATPTAIEELQQAPTTTTSEVDKQSDKQADTIKVPPLPKTSAEDIKVKTDSAKAVGDMFKQAGPKEEDIKEAQAFLSPFAKILNKLMAVILGATALLMMLITVLDLLYMAFPPVRDMLDGGNHGMNQPQRCRQRGMGMRGYRNPMMSSFGGAGQFNGIGQYGGAGQFGGMDTSMDMAPGPQQQQPHGGGLSAVGRWVSDEAISACMECQGGQVKLMLFSYMKKRSIFIILFGICVVLFTSTAFTDLGIMIGTKIMAMVMGINI